MKVFFAILTDLRAAIAVVAARERALTALLVVIWGRVGRVRTRIERLMVLWRAGKLPKARAPRESRAGLESATWARVRTRIPSGRGWLALRAWEVVAFGSQLVHLIETDPEFARFLAEVPQAARMLRPLCRLVWADPLPVVLRRVSAPAVVFGESVVVVPVGVVPEVVSRFLSA